MAAGLSRTRKYEVVRGALKKLERRAITLPEVVGTYRQGRNHLSIHGKNSLIVIVQYRWIHASNGECFAFLYLNGVRQEFGNNKDRIREALAK